MNRRQFPIPLEEAHDLIQRDPLIELTNNDYPYLGELRILFNPHDGSLNSIYSEHYGDAYISPLQDMDGASRSFIRFARTDLVCILVLGELAEQGTPEIKLIRFEDFEGV